MAYLENKNATLVDVLDTVIDKGAVVQGDLVIRIADLDLLAIQLKLILVSFSRLETQQGKRVEEVNRAEIGDETYLKKLENQIEKAQAHINQMINANNPGEAESGLAKLVLTLIKVIVDLVEREAARRVQGGHLTQTEIEKLGLNLQAIESKLEELRLIFGLKKEDLNLDLGPLGRLR
ncbi:MAG: gas vesicle protein K [Bacteroidia bacterium]|nr:gas vesicle protein K [Bacteroidia bacterium]